MKQRKPRLLNFRNRDFRCSMGDWSTQQIKPKNVPNEFWLRQRRAEFADHVRRFHPPEKSGKRGS